MRIGGKKLILSLGLLCLLFSLCSSQLPNMINNNMKAESTEIDDGPLGEKIVDIGFQYMQQSAFAVTENGEVYAWCMTCLNGETLGVGKTDATKARKPNKVLAPDGQEGYLQNIKQIYVGGYRYDASSMTGNLAVIAVTEDNQLYAWGDNRFGILGLPEKKEYLRPTLVPLDFEFNKIVVSKYFTSFISTTGDVYVSGTSPWNVLGLGPSVSATNGIEKLTRDVEGNSLPPIKEVSVADFNMFLLAENGNIYATGNVGSYIYSGTNKNTNDYPTLAVIEDGTPITGVENIISQAHLGALVVNTNNGIYISKNMKNNANYFAPLSNSPYFTDPNHIFDRVASFDAVNGGSVFITDDQKLYFLDNYPDEGFASYRKYITVKPYAENEITQEYQGAKKVISAVKTTYVLLLTENGGVYMNGKKVTFGDVFIKGTKSDGSTYKNNEKHNDSVSLLVSSTYPIADVRYTSKNLITNEVSSGQNTSGTIDISINDNERFYQTYEVYIDGKEQETKTSFTVDLYKQTPTLELKNDGIYPQGKKITLGYNGFAQNTISAKITKDGVETDYVSGSELTEVGSYTINIVDLYGNTNTYTFAITDAPIAEGVLFTPTDPDGLIYGNDCTKTGNTIGTLSLKYPTGKPTYEIDTITLGDSATSQFEIVNKTQLKVIGNNLNAGTYTIPVTGTDTNGMDFSGSFTITIAKANQTMDWTDALKAYQSSGINKDTKLTLQVKDVLDDAEVTYGLKESNTCVSVVPTTGVVTITCVPDSKEISLTATAKATTNYDTKTIELTLPFTKEYIPLTVATTSENKAYTSGTWAKHDVTFTITGGLSQDDLEGYEYAVTDGSNPNNDTNWTAMSTNTLALTSSIKDKTYWFRVVPHDPSGTYSKGIKVNLDVDQPSIPTLSVEEINQTEVAKLINMLSFGNWMNKQAKVTMTSNDTTSGVDHYEYIEKVNGTESQPKKSSGTITYGDKTELTLKARACDKAGNCSAYTNAEEVKIDLKAPTITGVKDQGEYKQYYLPRFVTVTDPVSGLKQATYKKDNTPAGTFTDNVETPIRGQGTYEIYAIDEAGNEVTLTFKIVKLPDIETEIDGSDESREIIDQIIKEYEEVKEKIDQNEKDNYEQWIKEAEEKWDSLRTKVVEDDKTTSKVEGQGDTTFDPKTELIVEEIPKDKVPVLPKNAIKTFDVYLKKGNDVVSPDGTVKVYLPYKESEAPIVYEINADGSYKEITVSHEGEYVTFVTNTLKKYAISNTAQEDTKKDICVLGPDGKSDTTDDVCGEGNGSGVPPVKEEDGTVTVPDGGKVIFPDKEVPAPDGAIINPDGSVDFPDGSHYDPDGNKTKDPDQKPDPNPDDDKNENICVAGPDGKLGTDDDVCGEGNGKEEPEKENNGSVTVPDGGKVVFPDKEVPAPDGATINPDGSVDFPDGTHFDPDGNKTKDPDQKPDPKPNPDDGKKPDNGSDNNDKVCVAGPDGKLGTSDDVCGNGNDTKEPEKNPDGSITVPDGGSVIFPDGNEVELPDGGTIKPDGSVELPDGTIYDPNGNKKDPNKDKEQCKLEGININIDTDKDNLPDINLDTDGDCKADINIDIDNDNIPDLNIDNNGDGKADINIDTDGDGIADLNIMLHIKKWIPNLNGKINGFSYDTMSGLEPDLNVDDNGDGQPDRNIDTDGDNIPDVNVDDDWFTKHGMKEPNDNSTVQGNYNKGNSATSGVNTGDSTKWIIWWIILLITLSSMTYALIKRRKKRNNKYY